MRRRALPRTGLVAHDAGMATRGKWGYGYGIGGTAFLVIVVLLAIWIIA